MDLTKTQNDMLKKVYYKDKNYFGRDKLFYAIKNLENHPTQIQVNDWLKKQEVHQLHLKPKPSNILKPIITSKPYFLFQMDLVDMGKYAYNDERYILTLIDVFTKKAFVKALKNKTPENILNKFKRLYNKLKHNNIVIKRLQTDNGAEFKSDDFEDFLVKNDIKHIFSLPGRPQSQGVIERFNGTFKSLIHKTMVSENTKDWPSLLDKLTENYNNSYHSTIKIDPNHAAFNKTIVYDNIQNNVKHSGKSFTDIEKGDKVRLKLFKGGLGKYSTQNWSSTIYPIIRVQQPKLPYASTKYYIPHTKTAYSHNDVQKITEVKKTPSSIKKIPEKEWEVDKITDQKKFNGLMKYKVYWRGYSDPTWEPFKYIKDTIAYGKYLKSN